MRKLLKTILLASSVVYLFSAPAFAGLSGTIAADTTWTADSVIVISGNITVNSSVTLTILAGAIVKFDGNYTITINGALVADGTSANKITFTSNNTAPSAGNWGSITFSSQSGTPASSLSYCLIQYATVGVAANSIPLSSTLTVSNTIIEHCADKAVSVSNSNVSLQNDTLRNFANQGLYAAGGGTVSMGTGSVVTQTIPSRLKTGNGVDIENGTVASITGSVISYCNNGLYAYNGNNSSPNVTATGNIITQNNQGIWIGGGWDYPTVKANDNDIKNNVNWNAQIGNQQNNNFNTEFDFTDNYWGTTDGVTIAGKIYDYNNNSNFAWVKYLPFLNASKDSGGTSTSMNYRAGWIHNDTTWTQAGGPYIITGTIVVQNTKTLTIEAGAQLKFQRGEILVYGRLMANGTSGNNITFTSNRTTPAAGDWSGIYQEANGTDSSTQISYSQIQYAGRGITVENMSSSNSINPPVFSHVNITNVSSYGIYINNCPGISGEKVSFQGTIDGAGDKGIYTTASDVTIGGGTVVRNFANQGIYAVNNGSVNIGTGSVITQTVPGRLMAGNGLDVENGTAATITGSTINYCNNGIFIYNGNNSSPNVTVTGDVITQNNQGIWIGSGSGSWTYPSVTVDNNDIKSNTNWNAQIGNQGSNSFNTEFDFTGNYWGTTDGVAIASKIYDYNNNNNVAFIKYLPFLNASKDSGGTSTSMNYRAGWIHSDTTWAKSGSPYIITGIVVVQNTKTLTIQAGTQLKFQRGSLRIYGRVLANGTSDSSVVFTSNHASPAAGDWSGIDQEANGTDSSTQLSYCRIQYAGTGILIQNMNSTNSINPPVISQVNITNSAGYGIDVENCPTILGKLVSVQGTIDGTGDKGIHASSSDLTIGGGTVVRNFGNYGIMAENSSNVHLDSGSVITQNVPGRLMTASGISINNGSVMTITGAAISYCNTGVYAYDGNNSATTATIESSIINQNNQGVYVGSGSSSWPYPSVTANNNDIKNNANYNVQVANQGNDNYHTELDFTDNYWGTTDGVAIAGKIYDFSDNGSLAWVKYLPFLNASKDSGGVSTSMNYRAGWIHTDTTWTSSGSPYIITGVVIVENTKTLTIEPGTQVKFANGELDIDGRLLANGTSDSIIVFTSNKTSPAPGDWTGIHQRANGTDSSTEISNCSIQYAATGITVQDMSSSNSINPPVISNVNITNSGGYGIQVVNCPSILGKSVSVQGTIDGVQDKAIYSSASDVMIGGNTVVRNFVNAGIYATNGGTVSLGAGSMVTQTLPGRLETGNGVDVENGAAMSIVSSTISQCNNGLNVFAGSSTPPSLSASACVVKNNNNGVWVGAQNTGVSYPSLNVKGNDIIDNINTAVTVGSGSSAGSTVFDMSQNWWGAADSSSIDTMIYDYNDNSGIARVQYVPYALGSALAAPVPPGLVSPANGAANQDNSPTLVWNSTVHSGPYRVQVAIDSSFGSGFVVNDSTVTDTSNTPVWLQSNATYFWRVGATNIAGTVAWSQVRKFSVGTPPILTSAIRLNSGWSMISGNLIPVATPLDSVFGSVKPNIVIAKDGLGNVFWPALGLDGIGNWDYRKGYKVYADSSDTIRLTGTAVHPELTPMSLTNGWNLVSYLRDSSMSPDKALAGIGDTLIIAKDGNGNVYWPLYAINTIDSMSVGSGYQLYVSDSCTLRYPSNSVSAGTGPSQSVKPLYRMQAGAPLHYRPEYTRTGSNFTLLVEASGLSDGDEVGVWDATGQLVGSGLVSKGRALITVWGDDIMTKSVKDGADEGEQLRLTAWSAEKETETSLAITSTMDALTGKDLKKSLSYETDAVVLAQVKEVDVPKTYILEQNYPNPFNPTTTIEYGLPKEGKVQLEIYDVIGQRVKVLVDGTQSAGYHEIIFNAGSLSSGVYFYRLTTQSFSQVKKMMLIK